MSDEQKYKDWAKVGIKAPRKPDAQKETKKKDK